jgi:hypothetical protein
MRRFVYETLSGLPSKAVTGAIGISGVAATVWPDKFRTWISGLMTADQIQFYGLVGVGLFGAYWALLAWLRPKEGGDAPLQTTYGPHSPAIGAIHGNPTFNIGSSNPAETQPMKSPYGTAHLRPSGSGFRDAIEQEKFDFWTQKREPTRDATLAEALAYAEFGEWGRSFFDAAAKAKNQANEHLERFRQLAHDGAVTVWGKRRNNGIFQAVPRDHWTDHNIEWFDLLRGNARTENVMHKTPNPFLEIMVSRAQFEKAWPHATVPLVTTTPLEANEGVKQVRRSLIRQCRDLAHKFTRETPEMTFREFLESERSYADIRGHLSPDYLAKLNAVRTSYSNADGAKYPALVSWFLDDLDRLEKDWKL